MRSEKSDTDLRSGGKKAKTATITATVVAAATTPNTRRKFEMREKTASRLMNKGFCFIASLCTHSLFSFWFYFFFLCCLLRAGPSSLLSLSRALSAPMFVSFRQLFHSNSYESFCPFLFSSSAQIALCTLFFLSSHNLSVLSFVFILISLCWLKCFRSINILFIFIKLFWWRESGIIVPYKWYCVGCLCFI